ncbi:efflux RND transporter periplasmic adaptor subunit [Thiocapsa rosea]|uniref:Multidrug efflux pump subunit AcrA (Membrane-fusion protein) n=1 Tax=Thiocapsa rosea TaxID=69360 RepID=A0A495V5K1_9GAMM|nr:HlyD family efflux transporter periplasmic adaptor subunit [Thiocapsa rosea]RKT43078.1 multidrug efflux pump subunit AcrA (membrane-fusion protein) [Thiocapsa rosea]
MQRTPAYLPILLATVLSVLTTTEVSAHEGHDHGPPLPAPVTATLAPRVSAESADLELVAVLEDGTLTVYLDEFATNRPIEDAVLQVESGAWQGTATHEGEGVYRLDPGPLAEPGRHDLIFTIESPTLADLLLGALEVPDDPGIDAQPPAGSPAWYDSVPLLQGAVVLLALCSLALLLWRDHRDRGGPGEPSGQRTPPKGSPSSTTAAMMTLALLATTLLALDAVGPVRAHEGHDHGTPDPAPGPSAAGQAAARLPDGTLFVPKPTQRLLGIRTAPAEPGEWPDTFTLSGHVIPDPNASALVQAPLRGRIELPEDGLPLLGASIREGQVLAYLVPILDAVDSTDLQAEMAELDGRIENLARNLIRLRQLGDNAPRQELEETETEHMSLTARRRAIADSFSARMPLTAAVGGVLALRNASPGQIVAGGETLFTVVDPQRLLVEALLYDTDHATHFTSASATTTEGRLLRLTPIGSGYELRGHALPIQFRIEPDPPGEKPGTSRPPDQLVVRQPLTVVATMFHGSTGLRIPSAAVQRGPDGAELVWVHVQPEHFRPQRVRVRALGAGDSVVTAGLAAGDRVVSDGAALLGQVR